MDKQTEIREKINSYILTRGVKSKWICQQCGDIDEGLFSKFKNNKRDLWDSTLRVLEQFLVEHGVN